MLRIDVSANVCCEKGSSR